MKDLHYGITQLNVKNFYSSVAMPVRMLTMVSESIRVTAPAIVLRRK